MKSIPIITEEEKNGVYTRTIKAISNSGNEIVGRADVDIKSVLDNETQKLLDGGFDFINYGDLISARLKIKKDEIIKETISYLEKDFFEWMEYDNNFSKK